MKNFNIIQKISFTQKAIEKISYWYKLFYLRDRATIAYSDWLKAKGDKDLRMNHNLNADSIVFSVGGFMGNFAYDINFKYGCKVFLFEPVNEYYEVCVNRFVDNKKINLYNVAISDKDCETIMVIDGNASALHIKEGSSKKIQKVIVRSFASLYCELRSDHALLNIDLMEINIEGAEYALIKHIIEIGLLANINALQIQFHDFFPEANALRNELRILLKKTHHEKWCFPFCWELWIKSDS